ncbi:unnamed protein product [Paramecium octaurelia]|uniref:Arginase n=1 Tax=Paramecium octaurelia TaxID=43137 RepID=A0A8S1SYJ4_PAROT|nr:unnamed protein product [Paramecium octaurelia]
MNQEVDFIQCKPSITIDYKMEDLPKFKDESNIVVLFGFPYDEGTIRNKGRAGGENAYEQIMLVLKSKLQACNPSQKVIHVGAVPKQLTLEDAHEYLYQHVGEIYYQLPQAKVIVIGGSNDQSYPNFKGLVDGMQCKKLGVINIDSHLDVRPLLNQNQCHSGSPFRSMLEDVERFQNSKFVEFAIKGCTCSYEHYQYVLNKGGKVYFMEKDIRRLNAENQGLSAMNNVLTEFENDENIDFIFLSFDVDSINSAWCPGVSAPSIVGGLTNVEALSIMERAKKSKKIKLIDLSEFNPAVECERTSNLISEMIITFIL